MSFNVNFSANKCADDLRNIIIEFLYRNGIALRQSAAEYITFNSSGEIVFSFSCANSDYTRAIGLLFILFSQEASGVFLRFVDGEIIVRPKSSQYNQMTIKWVEQYMNPIVNW